MREIGRMMLPTFARHMATCEDVIEGLEAFEARKARG